MSVNTMSGVRRRLLVAATMGLLSIVSTVVPSGAAAAADLAPTALSITVGPTRLTYGTDLTITARLTDAQTGAPVPGATVQVERRLTGGTAYGVIATLVSDADGVVRMVHKPQVNADYAVRYDGDAVFGPSSAGPKRAAVAPRLTARLNKAAARAGSRVTLSGSLMPAHAGRSVRIERYYSGAWRLVTTATLSSSGTYSSVLTVPAPGWHKYRVVRPADRDNLAATTLLPKLDSYRLHTYIVRSRGTIKASMSTFAATVASTYGDGRGWVRGHHRFTRVSSGGDFTVLLAEARYVPTYNSICSIQYSCRVGRYVIINQDRWRYGSRYFPGTLTQYRQMVINHETGHWLGNRHAYCGGAGQLAPVMQQQSKGMQGCKPNAWPLAREL
jgi:hypothetical protein